MQQRLLFTGSVLTTHEHRQPTRLRILLLFLAEMFCLLKERFRHYEMTNHLRVLPSKRIRKKLKKAIERSELENGIKFHLDTRAVAVKELRIFPQTSKSESGGGNNRLTG